MATTSPVPSLSQIRAWETEHLVDAATTWRTTADQWQGSFFQVASHMPAPGGTPWEGAASEAAQSRASADAMKVDELAASLRSASTVAGYGADEIDAKRQAVLEAIESAESVGFTVGEDLSVTSRYTDLTPEAEAARQAQAQVLAADINAKATALATADYEVAAKVASAASGVRDVTFGEGPGADTGADSTQDEPVALAAGWKQGPSENPAPPPPSPPPPVRGLPPEGLQPPVSGTLTPGPASRPSEQRIGGQSLWDEKGGEWRYYPGNKHHNPHWDYNPHNVPNSRWQNVPINNLPPLKGGPAPVEAAPPRPAVPVPPPAEAPPVRGGPPGGLPLGGGPLPDGTMPHLVDPPGPDAGGPDLPVIGDGKPDVPDA
ncbi:hypothetical protein [Mycobacterium deserti]|uniref:ESX-1 secretion-associated protein EspA/EspE-like domain-containing protein n=1 Tax=Mycobacterium deserti TaxID=2978347 RepID=A0ABT2M9R4_9MYCO|nr:hypothetical protein [Mycobacterium deserti]MCT7658344.1 hypothetical protein [Mycobacterium deserti]